MVPGYAPASPMTDAATRRPMLDADLSGPERLNASALQALAASVAAGGKPEVEGAARRGPFRPDVWRNARQRHASRLAAHYFRSLDVLAVAGVTLLCPWAPWQFSACCGRWGATGSCGGNTRGCIWPRWPEPSSRGRSSPWRRRGPC